MKILAIDCSAITASVAITDNNKLLGEFFIDAGLTHSQTLMPMVKCLLSSTNIQLENIDYFAISVGPGSFTGLRIGIAAVKGMAAALKKPCVAVSTLTAIAYNFSEDDKIICAVMDARCKQVYNALFCFKNNVLNRITADRAISLEQLKIELDNNYENQKIAIVGDGTDITKEYFKGSNVNIININSILKYQRASSVAMSAYMQIKKGDILTAAQLMPTYLRLPQAERELKKKQKN